MTFLEIKQVLDQIGDGMKRFDEIFSGRMKESWIGIVSDELLKFIRPKCQELLTIERLKELLDNKGTLRIKFGIDPTATEIHIGHAVPIMLLRQFVKAGHRVDLIIGDFTARVGDPTERETGRAPLTPEKIEENMRTYTSQVGKYIDLLQLNVHFNSLWLNRMSLQDVFGIFQKINLAEAMQREDFRARARKSQAVSLAEVCYGVLMGIDSVHLDTDVEVGGIDQLLNFQQCRKVMKESGMSEEVILMTPILEGTSGDGRKMSKSYGNYIAVNALPEDKFGKVMSVADQLVFQYFCSFADVHESELESLKQFIESNPFESKKQLATLLIALETGELQDGLRERENFERKFSKREITDHDGTKLVATADVSLMDVLMSSDQFSSRSELRRLFDQSAIRHVAKEGEILRPDTAASEVLGLVKVGKQRYFMITLSD